MISPGEAKVIVDVLGKRESYAKKIRTTPRIKNYIPSSSNLAKNINVLKIGRRIFF